MWPLGRAMVSTMVSLMVSAMVSLVVDLIRTHMTSLVLVVLMATKG